MDKENEFKPGDVVRHKATLKRCVILNIQEEKIKVRDQDNIIHYYESFELEEEPQSQTIEGGII